MPEDTMNRIDSIELELEAIDRLVADARRELSELRTWVLNKRAQELVGEIREAMDIHDELMFDFDLQEVCDENKR
jgi:hypothetical protein